jgi:hypothetical protein
MMLDHEREDCSPSKTKVLTYNMQELQLLNTILTALYEKFCLDKMGEITSARESHEQMKNLEES